MWPHPQFLADLVTFTEEILNVKYHFLCSVKFWEGSKYASDNLPARLFINFYYLLSPLLREKYPYSEFFWSLFSPYSVQIWENTDQKNSEYGHFSRCVWDNISSNLVKYIFLHNHYSNTNSKTRVWNQN